MNIAHNLMAMNTQRQYNLVTDRKKKSVEKLSSGYRVNRSADDAAGLAISEKMRRQIRGLTQGSRNIQDGISLCQVADGALSEVNDMLHRITELSVKSANGTNTDQDRQCIQEEIQQILAEIDKIGDTTTFNEQPLFKGGEIKSSTIPSTGTPSTASPRATLSVSGNPTDATAGEYQIGKNSAGELTINGDRIPWSDWKNSSGASLDLNNIKSGTYQCDYHGMRFSLNLKAGMTADDLVNALSGTSFRTVETSATKKVVSGIQVNTDSAVKVRGSTSIRMTADDDGIAIYGGGDGYSSKLKKVSWADMGVDTSDIKAGTYTHTNPYSKLDFTFQIDEDGISLEDLKKSFDGVEIGVKSIQDQRHYYGVRTGLENQVGNLAKSYLTGYVVPYEKDISQDHYLFNTANLAANTEGGVTSYIFKPKVDGDQISFVGQNTSSLIPTQVEFTITNASLNALKNYDYTQPSSTSNPNLILDFEAAGGQKFQLCLDNPNGNGSYEDVMKTLSNASFNYEVRFSSDQKDYLLKPQGDATAKDVSTSKIALEQGNVTIADTDLPGTVPEDDSQKSTSGDEMLESVKKWWIQCGAEVGDGLWIETGELNTNVLGINNLNVSTVAGANDAIDRTKGALHKLMSQRSTIGAEQNRLEHAYDNVMNIAENTQDAESRIRDTDMSSEMVTYSTANIISQAGESMMSQANQSNQGILNLLQ